MLTQLVAGFGSSSFGAFKAVNSRLDQLRETFAKDPSVAREVAHLKDNIGKVESLDELMDDYHLWQSVTTAFGLGDNAFAKGLFRKLMSEDSKDPKSLVNRMVDPRYKDIAKFFEVDTKGMENAKDPKWVEDLTEKFVTRKFENAAGAANPAVQAALYFQRKAPDITSYYQILSDERVFEVVRGGLNLPGAFSNMDIDRQVSLLKSKIDLDDFKSPAKLGRLIERHLAVSDAQSIQSGAYLGNSSSAVALQTFAAPSMTGFAPILQIDPTLFIKR